MASDLEIAQQYIAAFNDWLLTEHDVVSGVWTAPRDGRKWLADHAVDDPAIRALVAPLLRNALLLEPSHDPYGSWDKGNPNYKNTLRWNLLNAMTRSGDIVAWQVKGVTLDKALGTTLSSDPAPMVRIEAINALSTSWSLPTSWIPGLSEAVDGGLDTLAEDPALTLNARTLLANALKEFLGFLGTLQATALQAQLTAPLPGGGSIAVTPTGPAQQASGLGQTDSSWPTIALVAASLGLAGLWWRKRRN